MFVEEQVGVLNSKVQFVVQFFSIRYNDEHGLRIECTRSFPSSNFGRVLEFKYADCRVIRSQ